MKHPVIGLFDEISALSILCVIGNFLDTTIVRIAHRPYQKKLLIMRTMNLIVSKITFIELCSSL